MFAIRIISARNMADTTTADIAAEHSIVFRILNGISFSFNIAERVGCKFGLLSLQKWYKKSAGILSGFGGFLVEHRGVEPLAFTMRM